MASSVSRPTAPLASRARVRPCRARELRSSSGRDTSISPASLRDTEIAVPGGRAGHRFFPVSRAGCYVPGGRYALTLSGTEALFAVRPGSTKEQRAKFVIAWYRGLLTAEIVRRLPAWELNTGLHAAAWQTRAIIIVG